jgi:DNA-binding transcriptional regulator YbjK
MTHRIFRIHALSLAFLCVLGLTVSAPAQTVESITQNMARAYNNWIADLEDVTTVAAVEGSVVPIDSVITYQQKITGGSSPRFETQSKMFGGMPDMMPEDQDGARLDVLSNYHRMFQMLHDQAEYVGRETVDDAETLVLSVEDMTPFYEAMMAPPQTNSNLEVDARNGRFYIDSDQWTLRRISLNLTVERGSGPQTIEAVTTLSDYRTVNGLVYPYRVETMMDNMLSAGEKQQMQQRIDELEAQMEKMPPDRRKQMESMVSAQLNRMKDMVEGQMRLAFVVQDLKINNGPPAIFDQ